MAGTSNLIRHFVLALMLTMGLAQAASASAEEPYGPRTVRLFVVDRDTDQAKQVYLHDRRYFVAGEADKRYTLRLANVSNERVLVLLAVDGINVISGKPFTYYDYEGYILQPKQVADIVGWRKNDAEVEAFRFAPMSQSFAAQTGRPANVGVITMAVFKQAKQPPPVKVSPPRAPKPVQPDLPVLKPRPQDFELDKAAPPPPPAPPPPLLSEPPPPPPPPPSQVPAGVVAAAKPMARPEKLGTARGEVEAIPLPREPFFKATIRPDSLRVLEYDSTENLVAAGVIALKPNKAR
jgi:hypothetical protein